MYERTDAEEPELFDTIMRIARKQHKCCECRKWILHGDQYEHAKGLWEGKFGEFRTCVWCLEARTIVDEQLGGFVFCRVYEDLMELRSYQDEGSELAQRIDTELERMGLSRREL